MPRSCGRGDGILRGTVWREIWKNRDCYLYLLPFYAIFLLFVVLPVLISIFFSFTYYNVFQSPEWVGWKNYIHLLASDEVFLQAVKNTFLIALVTGPVGSFVSLMVAWLISDLRPGLRAVMVTVMYAPSISGGAFAVWKLFFSGDSYGYINSLLLRFGLVSSPVQFLTDSRYMIWVCILVTVWMSLGAGFLSFVSGFQTIDRSMYEAGYVEGIRNRWQELWYITLPTMKPQLMFGAVMSITSAFSCGDVSTNLFGFPSTDYAAHTVINHMVDYGTTRMEMGYACTSATLLFAVMIGANQMIQRLLEKVGR